LAAHSLYPLGEPRHQLSAAPNGASAVRTVRIVPGAWLIQAVFEMPKTPNVQGFVLRSLPPGEAKPPRSRAERERIAAAY